MLDSWNHTIQVRNGQETYRCCSFRDSPLKESPWKSVHKGKLLGPVEVTDAVVKVFRGQDLSRRSRNVRAEVEKHNLVREVLLQCPRARGLRLARTFHSEVDKVGRGSRLKSMLGKAGQRRQLREGESVVVQDRVKGQVQPLFLLTENQTFPGSGTSPLPLPPCLLQLVTLTYILTGHSCVMGAVKGVAAPHPADRGRVTYLLTSFTLHSLHSRFGDNDLGVLGVQLYQRWAGHAPRVPPPLPAPPSSRFRTVDEEDCTSRAMGAAAKVLGWRSCSTTPAPLAAFPARLAVSPSAPPCPTSQQCSDGRTPAFAAGQAPVCGGPAGGDPGPAVRRGTLTDVLAVCPQLRKDYSESFLTRLLGPAPRYSFACSGTAS